MSCRKQDAFQRDHTRIIMNDLISHAARYPDLPTALTTLHAKIAASDASETDKAEQHALLDTLARSEFWTYLLLNGGLNGDWTDYLINRYQHDPAIAGLEHLFALPLQTATRERNAHFKTVLQQAIRPGISIASVPCGLMRDVLSLDFPNDGSIRLDGYDLDDEALTASRALAEQYGLSAHCRFTRADAWQVGAAAPQAYDVCVSNGLNIYVPEPDRRVALYRSFHAMLKPGGFLVISTLTPPPGAAAAPEWTMPAIDMAGLQLTQRIYGLIQPRWSTFCGTADMREHLQEAGFSHIEVRPDRANMMPTFIAHRPRH